MFTYLMLQPIDNYTDIKKMFDNFLKKDINVLNLDFTIGTLVKLPFVIRIINIIYSRDKVNFYNLENLI